jgi:ABC-2 type transport system ATP-binding protein
VLFRFQNVTKTYGKITALDRLTVEAPEGAVGLLGPNGSGKTTLIRTLLGLIPVDEGTGEVLGKDFAKRQLDIRREVGFAPEDECLFPLAAGVEFVAYAGELSGMAPADAMQRAHETLDYVGLEEARYRRVETYSTGMKQRLKLASAIVHDPKLLILDEPTNGMDPQGTREIRHLVRELAADGTTVFVSSHLLAEIEHVCTHAAVMHRGRLLVQGSLAELQSLRPSAVNVHTVHGELAGRVLAAAGLEPAVDGLQVSAALPAGGALPPPEELCRRLVEAGVAVQYFAVERPSLEETFVALTGEGFDVAQ